MENEQTMSTICHKSVDLRVSRVDGECISIASPCRSSVHSHFDDNLLLLLGHCRIPISPTVYSRRCQRRDLKTSWGGNGTDLEPTVWLKWVGYTAEYMTSK